jgi:hypothetical protein
VLLGGNQLPKVLKFDNEINKVESAPDYVHHPAPAIVPVKLTDADFEFKSKSGGEGIHLQFAISKKAPKGKTFYPLHYYIMYDSDYYVQRMAELMDAVLGKRVKSLKPTDVVGKICAIKVRPEDYDGETTAKVARLLPLDDEPDDDEEDEDDEVDEEDEDEDEDDEVEDDEVDDEEEDEVEEVEDYNDYSIAQLRKEAERRGLDTKGNKKAIVARLEEDDETDETDEPDDDEEDEEVDYTEFSTKELKEEMRSRGLKVKRGMTDDDMVEALEEDDEADPLEDDE